LSNITSLKDY